MTTRSSRPGVSLIEVIVAMAIVAILIGLLLPAIQSVRRTAVRLQSCNNLKQIGLAFQQHDATKGRLPGMDNALVVRTYDLRLAAAGLPDPDADIGPLLALIPFIEGEPQSVTHMDYGIRKVFVSPGDPTLNSAEPPLSTPASYGVNVAALETKPNLTSGFPDGLTNTIAATERYFHSFMRQPTRDPSLLSLSLSCSYSSISPDPDAQGNAAHGRRASFADRGYYGEVVPVTYNGPNGPVTRPSVPGQTFQVQPKLQSAWSGVPQTPFAAGLPTLLFDGSVRTLSPGIDAAVFWGAVTRDKGEVLTDW